MFDTPPTNQNKRQEEPNRAIKSLEQLQRANNILPFQKDSLSSLPDTNTSTQTEPSDVELQQQFNTNNYEERVRAEAAVLAKKIAEEALRVALESMQNHEVVKNQEVVQPQLKEEQLLQVPTSNADMEIPSGTMEIVKNPDLQSSNFNSVPVVPASIQNPTRAEPFRFVDKPIENLPLPDSETISSTEIESRSVPEILDGVKESWKQIRNLWADFVKEKNLSILIERVKPQVENMTKSLQELSSTPALNQSESIQSMIEELNKKITSGMELALSQTDEYDKVIMLFDTLEGLKKGFQGILTIIETPAL